MRADMGAEFKKRGVDGVYVIDGAGTERNRTHDRYGAKAPPSVLPDISPARGEIGRPPGFRQSQTFEQERRD